MAALFALAAATISAFFAMSLLRRWRASRRMQEFAWAVSLAMYAAASLLVSFSATFGWSAGVYRIFWLFGAVLTVPWLALGSIALSFGRLIRLGAAAVVVALHPLAFWAVLDGDLAFAPFHVALSSDAFVSAKKIPRGSEAWGDALALSLGRWASIVGWVIVVAIAVWSSKPKRGLTPPKARVRANALIAAGVSIVAIGGFALGRVGDGEAFSVALALGAAVMYAGFRLAGRAPRYSVSDPGESPT